MPSLLLSNRCVTPSGSSLLFWAAVALLLWQKQQSLTLKSDTTSTFIGLTLLTLILYKSLHIFEADFFLRLSPLLCLLGWSLIASGWQRLKQYKQEIFLLSFLAIPWEVIYLFDISLLTAKFSTLSLWALGFDAIRQNTWIILPTGSIEVYNGCSGVRMMIQLLGLSWLILALTPTRWQQKLGLPIVAVLLGFFINGLRVALMAVLVAMGNMSAFDYWHVGTGSLVFSAIAVLLFGTTSVLLRR